VLLFKYTPKFGENITTCKRPSFMRYLTYILPYYTTNEIINLGLNMDVINEIDINKYKNDMDNINNLCKIISNNDITSNIIIEHNKHIIKNDMIGLMRYYTLQGSYFLNKYLRNLEDNYYINDLYNEIIIKLWNLITTSPKFDKKYVLYRFINNDNHIANIKIGDIYIENGFTSTTRDAFYNSEQYQFGFILLKIIIPPKKGVALCIETISNFPKEEEIILPPFSKLKLIKKDNNVKYYHTNKNINANIKIKYEFQYIENEYDENDIRNLINEKKKSYITNNIINFLNIKNTDEISVSLWDNIKFFIKNYVNDINQFTINLDNKKIQVISEWYNSESVYKNYYYFTTKNGYSMYSIYDNNLIFFIEFYEYEQTKHKIMYVNYMGKFNEIISNIMTINEFMYLISTISYYFQITDVRLHTSYKKCNLYTCDTNTYQQRSYINNIKILEPTTYDYLTNSFNDDFYKYISNKTKKYDNIGHNIITPKFSYYQLDILENTFAKEILNKNDKDELYQIYINIDNENIKVSNFIIHIVKKYSVLINILIEKICKIYDDKHNPFYLCYYNMNCIGYLYNNKFIANMPGYINNINLENIDLNKNIYRI